MQYVKNILILSVHYLIGSDEYIPDGGQPNGEILNGGILDGQKPYGGIIHFEGIMPQVYRVACSMIMFTINLYSLLCFFVYIYV